MAVITVSGEPGCPVEETARLAATRLSYKLFTERDLGRLIEQEFRPEHALPDRAFAGLVTTILARLAAQHHLVTSVSGSEHLLPEFRAVLRVWLVAPPAYRAGILMLDHHLERVAAMELLGKLEQDQKQDRRRKFGRSTVPPHMFDLTLNAGGLDAEAMTEIIRTTATSGALADGGLLPEALEAQMQFQARLQLARHNIRTSGDVRLSRNGFAHPSEAMFANLLDFYRIAWEYEPRSFPLKWDKSGRSVEAFTPDFYLPEFDLYVELTTMKQALVTRKNRKLKRLREIYPNINIQVFYEKDFRNLIFKYGLADRSASV